uniref:Putative secreted peptide n=1 Tax=Anopheles braziliensis TaxID=58242 RepID=A0A2M3ZVK3_9DIPT
MMLSISSLFSWFVLLSTRRPCWMTSLSSFSFTSARSTIFSSTVFSVIKRNTRTCFFCPIRCARSIACRSICGFQSES